jgi:hypothetical protein
MRRQCLGRHVHAQILVKSARDEFVTGVLQVSAKIMSFQDATK